MHPATLAAVRRFPLLGRPRPACPALPRRLQEITDAVHTAQQKAEHAPAGHAIADAAHALNKAALVAADAAMPHLARQLCWQHIDTYRGLERPLTIPEGRYLLEPVLNLARLRLRAGDGSAALRLLEAMYRAVTARCDLTLDGHTLPTASLLGAQHDRRRLREWVWLQLVGEGVRALALAGRWVDAAEHARTHHGIGVHLMEGRQAAIIAHATQGEHAPARALLAHSTPTQPWEQQIGACLHLMCVEPTDTRADHHLTTAVRHFAAPHQMPGYASYRARLGLTITTLASTAHPELATGLLNRVADEAIASADGYAARDVLGFGAPVDGITDHHRGSLKHLATQAGLGPGTLPGPAQQQLTAAAGAATTLLAAALRCGPSRQ
jgi:hypothetical protein